MTVAGSLRVDERAALDDIVAMCEELVARARIRVAAGARPLDAIAEVFLASDPRAIAGVALVSVLGALDAEATNRRFPTAVN